jgi:hypothetical protein
MNRIIGGIAVALLFVACAPGTGGTATGGLPTNNPIDTGAIGSAAGDARTALCDPSSDTGLKGLSTQIAAVDPNSDTTALQTNLGTAATNLQGLQVTGAQTTLKDAAATAIQQIQSALSNPSTLSETKANAVTAIDALYASLCM